MIVLGLLGALKHDPSAALLVDGEVVAAAEEERFTRDKHAKNTLPLESAKFCLEYADIDPADIEGGYVLVCSVAPQTDVVLRPASRWVMPAAAAVEEE